MTVTSPIWLIKTRMQLQTPGREYYKNSLDCAIRIGREEGIRGYFKGLSASYLGNHFSFFEDEFHFRYHRDCYSIRFVREAEEKYSREKGLER